MTSKKQDSGRTMIEMIAVLILVGILTLSGIFGFSWLVQRYKKTENAKTANTVIAALQNSRIIKKSTPNEPITIKSVVSGPKTDKDGKVMVLSEEDDYFMVVTAMGPEEYIADLQIEPGTCAEYMNAFSENSALFKKEKTSPSDSAKTLLEDIASQNKSKTTFVPLSEEEIRNCEETGRFRAAFNVTGKTDDEGKVYLRDDEEGFYRCPPGEEEDANGNCCRQKACGNLCACPSDKPHCSKDGNCVKCIKNEDCASDQICNEENECVCEGNSTLSGGECKCDAGYTLNETTSTCEQCAVGTYKNWVGNDDCTDCPEGTTTSGEGSTSDTECMCGENAIWYNGECLCAEGYTWDSTQSKCTPCKKGTYKAGISNEACKPCAVGHYQDAEGQTQCIACGDHKTTDGEGSTAITQCVCDLGYTLNETTSTCEQCAVGTYKDKIGNEVCKDCLAGTYQDEMGKTSCEDCDVGHYQDKTGQTSCNPCKVGTYQKDTGAKSCTDCDANQTTAEEGSTESAQCVCMAGYTLKNGSCTPCDVGKYKAGIGDGKCTDCGANQTTADKGSTASAQCVCMAGYTLKNGTCQPCDKGTYKVGIGNGSCTACGDYKTTTGTGSTASAQCVTCAAANSKKPYWHNGECVACSRHNGVAGNGYQCPASTPYCHNGICKTCTQVGAKTDVGPTANKVKTIFGISPSDSSKRGCYLCKNDKNGNSQDSGCPSNNPICPTDSGKVYNVCCPTNKPIWKNGQCVTCATATNSAQPVWNGSSCEACPASTPKWNGTQCVACPASTPKWNGSACVTCAAVDSTKPVWNGSACVQCTSHDHCAAGKYCNSNGICANCDADYKCACTYAANGAGGCFSADQWCRRKNNENFGYRSKENKCVNSTCQDQSWVNTHGSDWECGHYPNGDCYPRMTGGVHHYNCYQRRDVAAANACSAGARCR